MTLNDMVDMLHPDQEMTVFVFDSETDRDMYRANEICFDDAVLFAVKSPFSCAFYLDKRFTDAEVSAVCPVSGDTVDIIIKEV